MPASTHATSILLALLEFMMAQGTVCSGVPIQTQRRIPILRIRAIHSCKRDMYIVMHQHNVLNPMAHSSRATPILVASAYFVNKIRTVTHLSTRSLGYMTTLPVSMHATPMLHVSLVSSTAMETASWPVLAEILGIAPTLQVRAIPSYKTDTYSRILYHRRPHLRRPRPVHQRYVPTLMAPSSLALPTVANTSYSAVKAQMVTPILAIQVPQPIVLVSNHATQIRREWPASFTVVQIVSWVLLVEVVILTAPIQLAKILCFPNICIAIRRQHRLPRYRQPLQHHRLHR